MQRYLILLAGFCMMAVVAILYLRPTPAVRFEGELATLTPEDALVRLNIEAGRLEFGDNLALAHARLALDSGDFLTARTALDVFGDRKSANPLVEEQLSEIARIAGKMPEATLHLFRAFQIEPTADRRRTLGTFYRTQRNVSAEIEILRSVPVQKLSDWEVERLAQLLSATGQYGDLEALLRTAADRETTATDVFRSRFIDFLAEDGRLDEAVGTALRWFQSSRPDQRPLTIAVVALIDRGEIDAAYYLARQSLNAAPETFHVLLPLFLRSGHRAITLELQDRWLAVDTKVSGPEWQTLVDLAAASGDLRGLRTALAVTDVDRIDPPILNAVMLQFLRYQGAAALEPYRAYMTPRFLRVAPLIGAAWMSLQGRSDEAFAYLSAASSQPLTDWDRDIWMSIADRARGTQAYVQLVKQAAVDDGLRAALAARFIAPTGPTGYE